MMTCREVTIHTVCNLVMELYAFLNCIDAVMVCVITLSVIDRGFEPWTWCCNSQCDCLECGGFEPRSVQTKDYKIGICCFSTKHAVIRSKVIFWLPIEVPDFNLLTLHRWCNNYHVCLDDCGRSWVLATVGSN
jgi:hypothetical protein